MVPHVSTDSAVMVTGYVVGQPCAELSPSVTGDSPYKHSLISKVAPEEKIDGFITQ